MPRRSRGHTTTTRASRPGTSPCASNPGSRGPSARPDGSPVAGAQVVVAVKGQPVPGIYNGRLASGWQGDVVRTDRDGRFGFAKPDEGGRIVIVSDRGLARRTTGRAGSRAGRDARALGPDPRTAPGRDRGRGAPARRCGGLGAGLSRGAGGDLLHAGADRLRGPLRDGSRRAGARDGLPPVLDRRQQADAVASPGGRRRIGPDGRGDGGRRGPAGRRPVDPGRRPAGLRARARHGPAPVRAAEPGVPRRIRGLGRRPASGSGGTRSTGPRRGGRTTRGRTPMR